MKYEVPVFADLKSAPRGPAQLALIPTVVDLPPDLAVEAGITRQIKRRRATLKRLAFERAQLDKQVKAVLAEIADLYKIRRRRQDRRYYKRKASGPEHQETPGEHQP